MGCLTAAFAGGALDLIAGGPDLVRLRRLGVEVVYTRGGRPCTWRPALRPDGDSGARAREGSLALALELEACGGAIVVRARLRNEGTDPIRLERLAPIAGGDAAEIRIGSGTDRWSVLREGWQSWSGTRSFRAGEIDPDPYGWPMQIVHADVRRASPQQPGKFRSDLFAAVKNLRSGESVVLGFLDGSGAFGSVEVYVDAERCSRLAAFLDFDGVAVEPGAEVEAAPLWIGAGLSTHELLGEYASAVGAAMRARVPAHVPVGWCSWYYYFTHVTEDRVLENVRALVRLRRQVPCEYVQVDDGYQAAIGDWLTPNEKFPHGMGWLAEQIRDAGFEAGLWTAPFIAHSRSRLLAQHPDWFVRNDRGRPRFALWNPAWGWLSACYALDTTHPEVLEWLRSTFRTIAREWGYRILKLDFLYAAALPGRRHDPNATRAAALRRGLEAVREGAGDDAFLLGCGCPLGPAIGVVDAMRIGPDVTPFWSNAFSRFVGRDLHGLATKHAVRNTLTRAFLHRKWWLNDPDCLMIRDSKTKLSLEEARTLATVIALTDGMLILSDRVESLPPERVHIVRQVLHLLGGEAHVVDLMHGDVPELLVSRAANRVAVAAFNFSDGSRRRKVDLTAAGVRIGDGTLPELWTATPLQVRNGWVDFGEVPAHGCRVIEIK